MRRLVFLVTAYDARGKRFTNKVLLNTVAGRSQFFKVSDPCSTASFALKKSLIRNLLFSGVQHVSHHSQAKGEPVIPKKRSSTAICLKIFDFEGVGGEQRYSLLRVDVYQLPLKWKAGVIEPKLYPWRSKPCVGLPTITSAAST